MAEIKKIGKMRDFIRSMLNGLINPATRKINLSLEGGGDGDSISRNLSGFVAHFDHKLRSSPDTQAIRYYKDHYHRFIETFRLLLPHIGYRVKCLEIGGISILSEYISATYKDAVTDSTVSDLRYPLDIADAKYDIVINTETIEHIKDQDTKEYDELDRFTFSGINTLLSECYRVLVKNGKLILSTPNSISLNVLHNVLSGNPPYFYYDHVRELSPHELKTLLERIGFSKIRLETLDCWNLLGALAKEKLIATLNKYHFPTSDRGECIFLIAEK